MTDEFGKGAWYRGAPPANLIRYEVGFEDLSEDVRRTVLEAYREMWNLDG